MAIVYRPILYYTAWEAKGCWNLFNYGQQILIGIQTRVAIGFEVQVWDKRPQASRRYTSFSKLKWAKLHEKNPSRHVYNILTQSDITLDYTLTAWRHQTIGGPRVLHCSLVLRDLHHITIAYKLWWTLFRQAQSKQTESISVTALAKQSIWNDVIDQPIRPIAIEYTSEGV